VESAVTTVADVGSVLQSAPVDEVYVEVPVGDDPAPFVEVLATHGLRAKIRTGGVVAQSFPPPAQVARFLGACALHQVAFKATAGLHHPLRGTFPFTYDAGAARGEMFGYLNVFVAATFARTGMSFDELTRLLDERDPAAFRFTDTTLSWRGHRRSLAELAATREQFALSFGSCSFREPLDDLSALALS
jgi:hypothetical protein